MNPNHVITIDQEVMKFMNTQMKKPPKLLHKSAGYDYCCIFRVPQSLFEINREAYQPQIVSIGPYHHGNKHLEMIEEHKWRYLDDLIQRTGNSIGYFMEIIVSMQDKIRQSYSESIDHFSANDLAKMMVLDGFFLIELFRKVGKLVETKDDPIFRMVWVSPFLMRDLLKIENQIPFFVLQKLFDESKPEVSKPDYPTLSSLILEFFNYTVDRKKKILNEHKNTKGKHLLDFFRKSFINPKEQNPVPTVDISKSSSQKLIQTPTKLKINNSYLKLIPPANKLKINNSYLKLIPPANKLKIVGVKFKASHEPDSFLDIEFRNGVLSIPQINMDDFYSSFFLNCVAFELCYFHCSKHITTYIVFMGCLMNTSSDVGVLSEDKIIENYFGTDKELAKFFKNVGKDVAFDIKDNYLTGLFVEVNEYCENGWHVHLAGFKHTYFESPWAAVSAFAAFLLLCFAGLQTFYTVYQYYKAKKE
ncbi:unnamed protein product [Lactuca saligna]|uniref:Uncharacterized protein n=1 Tax=Lactuca saligna TaxID=75948 RepID=A0AA35ZCD0_LACSI|nr:unnamed protein product [Lactuca saligna]